MYQCVRVHTPYMLARSTRYRHLQYRKGWRHFPGWRCLYRAAIGYQTTKSECHSYWIRNIYLVFETFSLQSIQLHYRLPFHQHNALTLKWMSDNNCSDATSHIMGIAISLTTALLSISSVSSVACAGIAAISVHTRGLFMTVIHICYTLINIWQWKRILFRHIGYQCKSNNIYSLVFFS